MDRVVTHFGNSGWEENSAGSNVQGSAFNGGALYRGSQVADLVPEASADTAEWQERLLELNGFFALVAEDGTSLVAAVDRVRSLPLFYGSVNGTLFLSDDAEWVRQQVGDAETDPVAREEFQLAGYVTGPDTLFPNVKQLQAGEMLRVHHPAGEELAVTTHRYYRFTHTEPTEWDEAALRKELDQVTEASVRRLVEYAGGRQIVIPLSGGYDSRLIALMLKRSGYDNILTFTYGVPGNKESDYSRRVAEALNLPWHFVEYNAEKWRKAWQTDERLGYQRWGSNWVSLPIVQDWLAVRELKATGVIRTDAVFCPGHTGDFIAGGHIPNEVDPHQFCDANQLARFIVHKHLSLAPWRKTTERPESFWHERILDRVESRYIQSSQELADSFEAWEWQERQAKLIVNSVKVYAFFGYDWWLPFWDSKFMAFWERVPLSLRKGKWFYDWWVDSEWQEAAGSESRLKACNDGLPFRRFVPMRARKIIKKFLPVVGGSQKLHSSLDRYSKKAVIKMFREGYSHNGIVVQFLLSDLESPVRKPNM